MIRITPFSRIFYFVLSMSFAAEVIQAKLTVNLVDRSLITVTIGLVWAYLETWDLMRDFQLHSFTKLKDWIVGTLGYLFVELSYELHDYFYSQIKQEDYPDYDYTYLWWARLSGWLLRTGAWFYMFESDFED